jgi:hypothetical protein
MKTIMVAVLLAVAFLWSAFAADPIPLQLGFASAKEGPFSPKFPTVKKSGPVWVKVTWEGFVRKDEIKEPYLMTWSMKNDFAGAGKTQDGEYIARPNPYYFPMATTEQIFELSIGERKEGTMGVMNRWDKDANAFVDAPLPACAPLPAGTYEVAVRLYYYLQGQPETGARGESTFTLTVVE